MRYRPAVLFSPEQIQRRVKELGAEITASFTEAGEVCAIGLMKSCMVFMADLVREVPLDLKCYFLRASSHLERGPGAVRTDIVYSTEIPYEGREILLIDDVIDTGITLGFLVDQIRAHNPKSLRVVSLIDKPGMRKQDVRPDWTAFTVENDPTRFIVGYGLDREERYRGLPYIGTIPRSEPSQPKG